LEISVGEGEKKRQTPGCGELKEKRSFSGRSDFERGVKYLKLKRGGQNKKGDFLYAKSG